MIYRVYKRDTGARLLRGKKELYRYTVDMEIATRAAVYTKSTDKVSDLLDTLRGMGFIAEKAE